MASLVILTIALIGFNTSIASELAKFDPAAAACMMSMDRLGMHRLEYKAANGKTRTYDVNYETIVRGGIVLSDNFSGEMITSTEEGEVAIGAYKLSCESTGNSKNVVSRMKDILEQHLKEYQEKLRSGARSKGDSPGRNSVSEDEMKLFFVRCGDRPEFKEKIDQLKQIYLTGNPDAKAPVIKTPKRTPSKSKTAISESIGI